VLTNREKQTPLKCTFLTDNFRWDDVIETLSVGYYNYYILKYSEELQK
jgi:hypothetical protein